MRFYMSAVILSGVLYAGLYNWGKLWIDWWQHQNNTPSTAQACPAQNASPNTHQVQNILMVQQIIRKHQIANLQHVLTHHPEPKARVDAQKALISLGALPDPSLPENTLMAQKE